MNKKQNNSKKANKNIMSLRGALATRQSYTCGKMDCFTTFTMTDSAIIHTDKGGADD